MYNLISLSEISLTFLSQSDLEPTQFLYHQSCFFLPCLCCTIKFKDEYHLACEKSLLYFCFICLVRPLSEVDLTTKPPIVGSRSLNGFSSTWSLSYMSFKTLVSSVVCAREVITFDVMQIFNFRALALIVFTYNVE